MEVSQQKQLLRKELIEQYEKCGTESYVESACKQVADIRAFQDAETIIAYHPILRIEIPFIRLLQSRHPLKKWLFIPQNPNDAEVYVTKGMEDAIDMYTTVLLVPSLALDSNGNRLGKGGGFYDRFLAQHATLKTISVVPAYAYRAVPNDDHDARIMHPLCAVVS